MNFLLIKLLDLVNTNSWLYCNLTFPVMDIDSVGTFTMCHEALKYLKKGGPGKGPSAGGIILNISATLHYTASWYQIHVSAAKVLLTSFYILVYFHTFSVTCALYQ